MSQIISNKIADSVNFTESLKSLNNSMGGTFGLIVILGVFAAFVGGSVGFGYLSVSSFEQKAEEEDDEITLKFDSEGIPAFHKFILFKVFSVIIFVAILTIVLRLGSALLKKGRK
jgi:hypothetical protein